MSDLKINVLIDNQSYSQSQLDYIQFEREKHVLQEMIYLGANIIDGNKSLSYDDINYLGMEDAKRILINTKAELGAIGTKELYKDSLERSAQMWRDIVKDYRDGEPLQESFAYANVSGITVQELQASIQHAVVDQDISGLAANPEHFAHVDVEGLQKNEQCAIETMGMYGGPTEFIVIFDPRITGPTKEENGFRNMISGTSKLMDGTIRQDIAVHQIKPNENGFELKMAVYFPEKTPKELVNGHKIHLAIEFLEAVKIAYKNKCNSAH